MCAYVCVFTGLYTCVRICEHASQTRKHDKHPFKPFLPPNQPSFWSVRIHTISVISWLTVFHCHSYIPRRFTERFILSTPVALQTNGRNESSWLYIYIHTCIWMQYFHFLFLHRLIYQNVWIHCHRHLWKPWFSVQQYLYNSYSHIHLHQ